MLIAVAVGFGHTGPMLESVKQMPSCPSTEAAQEYHVGNDQLSCTPYIPDQDVSCVACRDPD